MKILSPADSLNEAELLIENGADELYGGFLPDFWEDRYGHVASINRRSFQAANIGSFDEVERIVEHCWNKGVLFFLVLNAPLVPDEEIDRIIEFATLCGHSGVSGLIVSDLSLLASLKVAGVKAELHASTLLTAFSFATIRFLESLGASRVVLSRELALEETCDLSRKTDSIRLEVMAFRGKCPNIEGFCSHLHDDPDRRWPCELPYRKKWVGAFDRELKEGVFEHISEWEGFDRYYSCGICALPALSSNGLHSAKIVGRGAETERKVRAVRVVKKMLDFCRDERDVDRCVAIGRSLYVEEFGTPCSGKNCYFPEFFTGEGS